MLAGHALETGAEETVALGVAIDADAAGGVGDGAVDAVGATGRDSSSEQAAPRPLEMASATIHQRLPLMRPRGRRP
jgi:hypothetical protein